jgi:hypothetical protein
VLGGIIAVNIVVHQDREKIHSQNTYDNYAGQRFESERHPSPREEIRRDLNP